jgi:hypothetical protein
MTTWDKWAIAIILALLLAILLQGCGPLTPQHLNKNVEKYLGRELSLETEVDVREYVDGPIDIYGACSGLNPIIWLLSTPLLGGYLFGCAERQCGENKLWETDKPCTCEVHLALNIEWVREHEMNHCKGYDDF